MTDPMLDHKCKKIAQARNMGPGREMWMGKLIEPIPGHPQETHCLHITSPYKSVVWGVNMGDMLAYAILTHIVHGEISTKWLDTMADLYKKEAAKHMSSEGESAMLLPHDEEEQQTCPSRMNQVGPWEKEEGLDTWRQVGPDRVCSFCGSLHPEELEAILDRCIAGDGTSIDPSTKGYKFYIRRDEVTNAGEGAIKFYIWHSPFTGEDAQRIQGKLNEAIKLSMERLRAQLNKGGGA